MDGHALAIGQLEQLLKHALDRKSRAMSTSAFAETTAQVHTLRMALKAARAARDSAAEAVRVAVGEEVE